MGQLDTLIGDIDRALVTLDAVIVSPPPPPPPPSLTMPGLTFTSITSGRRPWACGQAFKRGAIPAGSGLAADCAEFQAVPVSYHDDGSWRFARLAGYCDMQAVPSSVPIRLSLVASTNQTPHVRTRDPVRVFVDGVACAVTRTKTIAAGAYMRHDQLTCKLDEQLAVVYELREFSAGQIEVLAPCIENCGFLAPSQPMRSVTVRVEIEGVVRFDALVDVKHHTRVTLTTGSAWSYLDGESPTGRIEHDRAYLCACETFPPYAPVPASALEMAKMVQTYTPNWIGESGGAMGSGGYSPHIGLLARANLFVLTTGGERALNYMMAEAFSSGSWPIHFRDEATGNQPLPADHPSLSLIAGTIPAGSGATNGAPDIAHQPQLTYSAALLTGWQFFVDEALAWVMYNHFTQQPFNRQYERGILRTDVGRMQDRGAAWALRSLGQCIALLSTSSPHFAPLVAIMQNNAEWYSLRYVDGTIDAGRYLNDLGVIAPYSSMGTSLYAGVDRGTSVAWWGAGWMQSLLTQSLGHLVQLSLPISAAARSDLRDVFLMSARLIVGLCGPTHWRRFGVYAMPFWSDGMQKSPPPAWYTFAEMWQEYETGKGLTTLDPSAGGTIKRHSTNTDIDGAYWQTGMVSYHWPALVYAVMHAAPGADAALARIMSSASWTSIAAGVQNPIWTGMMPPGVTHPGA